MGDGMPSPTEYLLPMDFPIPLVPFSDEWPGDQFLRAVVQNSYPGVSAVMRLLTKQPHVSLDRLQFGGAAPSEPRSCAHSSMAPCVVYRLPDPQPANTIDFFGTELPTLLLSRSARRIGTRALKQAVYLRAVWMVKALTFDPATKELLLDRCPVCRRALSFALNPEIRYCGSCGIDKETGRWKTDFLNFPQPIVPVDDVEALDFITGLVDPAAPSNENLLSKLHDDFNGLARGDLFHLSVKFAVMLANTYQLPRAEQLKVDQCGIDASLLGQAGRTVLSWPQSFYDLVDGVDGQAGFTRIERSIHSFPEAVRTRYRFIRDRVREARIRLSDTRNNKRQFDDPPWSSQNGKDIERLTLRRLTAARGSHDDDLPLSQPLLDLAMVRAKPICRRFARQTGLATRTIAQLCESGLLPRQTLRGRADMNETAEGCAKLLESIVSQARPHGKREQLWSLWEVSDAVWPHVGVPWAPILQAIADREIALWYANRPKNGVLKNLLVDKPTATTLIVNHSGLESPNVFVTRDDAAILLNISTTALDQVVGAGLLPALITSMDISRFRATYMLLSEAKLRLRMNGSPTAPVHPKNVHWTLGESVLAQHHRRAAVSLFDRNLVERHFAKEMFPRFQIVAA
jgi:hypothetical protein